MRRLLPAALILATALVSSACGAPGSSRTTVPHQVHRSRHRRRAGGSPPGLPGEGHHGASADFPESDCRPISTPALECPWRRRPDPHQLGERAAYMSALRQGSIGAVPRVHRVPSSRIWRHRAPLQAGRPDSAHGRCLQRSFGQADHDRPRRTRRTGRQGRRPGSRCPHMAFRQRSGLNHDPLPGQPAAGGIAVPSTMEQDRRQQPAPAGERSRVGRRFRPVPCPTSKPFGTTISHRREACSCQLTSRIPTFSTPQATTYARRVPGSAPEAPSRR